FRGRCRRVDSPGQPPGAVFAPDVAGYAVKPGCEGPAIVKPVQRLPQSHKGVMREVRRVIGAVGGPEKPPIQTVVMPGHKLFAPVPLVLQLQWLTAVNHWSGSGGVSINRLPVRRVSLEISFAVHPFALWQSPPIL